MTHHDSHCPCGCCASAEAPCSCCPCPPGGPHHHRSVEDWQEEKLEWLIDLTKQAYEDFLAESIQRKLAEKIGPDVDRLSDIATEKFVGWWGHKKERMRLKRRFRENFEDFCEG